MIALVEATKEATSLGFGTFGKGLNLL